MGSQQLSKGNPLDLEPDITIDADDLILIPEGDYTLGYEGYETCILFYRHKVRIEFNILEKGEYYGTRLMAFYNVKKLTGPPGKNGHFKFPGRTSDLFRDMVRLFGPIKRADRFSFRKLKSILIKARVSTVINDSKGRKLPKSSQYSVINEIICAEKVEE